MTRVIERICDYCDADASWITSEVTGELLCTECAKGDLDTPFVATIRRHYYVLTEKRFQAYADYMAHD